jgi:iron-sulfur cluster repair protein YtfE (RIC family)
MSSTRGTTREPLHLEDVVAILERQHDRIREGFVEVKAATGAEKRVRFDELRALLAAHETAEEMVLRPVTAQTAGREVADALNAEEKAANQALAKLEHLDVDTPEFDEAFAEFQKAVLAHATHEERDEFPKVRAGRSEKQLAEMGRVLLAVEKVAPTHPHPSTAGSPTAQWVAGPFASVLDRARDALTSALRH